MRSFASDNNSGVHPLVMDAVIKANENHAVGYGDDPWTAAAVTKIKEIFGEKASPFFVFNGTGANSVALQAVTRSFNSILCAETAHINVDECGAPGRMTGCAIVTIPTPDGKLTPELIKPHLHNFGVCHHSQPKVVYISQVTELGTVYTIEEVKAIADLLHAHNMYLHMDGARLANACAFLNCSMKQVTVDAGVDVLSFGGTKNGMMMGEAVVAFSPDIAENLMYFRKQSAQLASKLRYLSAQFIPYLENNLWLENAMKANLAATKLADIMKQYPQICFTQKIESNALFFTIPTEALRKLQEEYFFYMWNEEQNEARLVTSWDTTGEDIAGFEESLKIIFSK
ncbi:MAG: low specificity L-threonine aldolase [Parabacteroides sp.]|jgi:threonine aldolase|nr:low specificity L-threonine aldolase [Parabacteroides sp.]MBP8758641.1 low specificity L-threonine aldolase [Parabacteroides sp.]MBP9481303.1 low specificity L-threonine aldolase [Parabacteroides sp.]MBP9578687.1 low specificity L-threonine aldolase [Parabacteroides sp.]